RQDASANELGRVLPRIREGERLLCAETDAGDEARDPKPKYRRRERAQDGENPKQQQIELINRLAAPPVAELALSSGADEHSNHGRASDQASLGRGRELGLDHVRDQRAQDDQVNDVEEIPGGDECDYANMERRDLCFIQRRADETLDCLGHGILPNGPLERLSTCSVW